jgi:predicted HicB family RNase H-like nuclease
MMFEVKHADKCVNKTFRFPESLIERLAKIADDNGISTNELLKQCAEYALSQMEAKR